MFKAIEKRTPIRLAGRALFGVTVMAVELEAELSTVLGSGVGFGSGSGIIGS